MEGAAEDSKEPKAQSPENRNVKGYVINATYLTEIKRRAWDRILDITITPTKDNTGYLVEGQDAERIRDAWKKATNSDLDPVYEDTGQSVAELPGSKQRTDSSVFYLDKIRKEVFDSEGLGKRFKLTVKDVGNGNYEVSGEDAKSFAAYWNTVMIDNLPSEFHEDTKGGSETSSHGAESNVKTIQIRVESAGEGGVGYNEEVPEGLPGIKIRRFDGGEVKLYLTPGAVEYLRRQNTGKQLRLINMTQTDADGVLDTLRKGRYSLDKPGSVMVSKIKGVVPLDGDGESAVLWVTDKQRNIMNALLKAKGDLAGMGDNVELRGPTEQFYQSCLTALVGPTIPSNPVSVPVPQSGITVVEGPPKRKWTLFGRRKKSAPQKNAKPEIDWETIYNDEGGKP